MDAPNIGRGGTLLTRESVRQRLEDRGQTVTDWARSNGFTREQVYAFLAGRTKGKRGITHRLAIALGVKAPPVGDPEAPLEGPESTAREG